MNLRGFYKATGICALIYAAVSLLSYGLWVSASGFLAVLPHHLRRTAS